MNNSNKRLKDYIKASAWSGSTWLFTLCAMLIVVVGIYVFTHIYHHDRGREYVQLDKTQLKIIKKLLDSNDDKPVPATSNSRSGKGLTDTTVQKEETGTTATKKEKVIDSLRSLRTELIIQYLKDEYDNRLISYDKDRLDTVHKNASDTQSTCKIELEILLQKMNNQEVYDYLSDKKLLIESAFWLTGSDVYIEAFLWSLLGVLVSLIFYVSTANANSVKKDGTDDIGQFDPGEIPSQVAKMFYAPAVTIIIVLGYHFLTDKSSNMVDISVNKGLIVFSFIAGFYSGRLMKFLDRLKDLLLPFDGKDETVSTKTNNTPAPPAEVKKDISVKLELAASLEADPPNAENIKSLFDTARVSMTREGTTQPNFLESGKDKAGNVQFLAKGVSPGKYSLNATLNVAGVILKGEKDIEVSNSSVDFEIPLDKA